MKEKCLTVYTQTWLNAGIKALTNTTLWFFPGKWKDNQQIPNSDHR